MVEHYSLELNSILRKISAHERMLEDYDEIIEYILSDLSEAKAGRSLCQENLAKLKSKYKAVHEDVL